MTDKVYYEDAGKGSHRRKEDKKAFESGFDAIDWSVKAEAPRDIFSEVMVGFEALAKQREENLVESQEILVVATSSEGQ